MAVQTSILDSEAAGDIAEEVLPDGVRYVLPLREPPLRWRLFGLGLVLVSVILAVGAVMLMIMSLPSAGTVPGRVLLTIVAGLMLITAIPLAWSGIAEWHGRQIVEVHGRRLDVIHCAGPLRWRRRHRLDRLRRLVISEHSHTVDGRQVVRGYLAHIAYRLDSIDVNGHQRALVNWYPRGVLMQLADRLAQRTDLPVTERNAESASRDTDQKPPDKPEYSRVDEQQNEGQITILVPPIPLLSWRGGMSVIGIAFSGLGAAATGLFVYSWLLGGGLTSLFTWVWLLLAIPAAGSWSALFVERIAQKETYFDILDDALLVTSRRWRNVDQHQWLADEIETVRCGGSQFKIDDTPAAQLQIMLRTGEMVTMLTGRDRDELNWLAWRLRTALDLPEPAIDQADDSAANAERDHADHTPRQRPSTLPAGG